MPPILFFDFIYWLKIYLIKAKLINDIPHNKRMSEKDREIINKNRILLEYASPSLYDYFAITLALLQTVFLPFIIISLLLLVSIILINFIP